MGAHSYSPLVTSLLMERSSLKLLKQNKLIAAL